MNYKLIENLHNRPNVLVHRELNEQGFDVVKVTAIGKIDDTNDMFAMEEAVFDTPEMAKSFVRDYSTTSAEGFCDRNGLSK